MKSLVAKLDAWAVEEAWEEAKALLVSEPKDPHLLELASHIALHRGDYQEALKLAKAAYAAGEEDSRKGLALFLEEAIGVLNTLKRFESPHFIIYLDEKQDGILADYLFEALEKTYAAMAGQYGFQPAEKIRVEVLPDARTFHYVSTLSPRDIEVAGAVGLTKFNKLMILSPRALVYGYRWLDAVSHEYMHYLIVKLTANKAPIWFHEGLSKYEETTWRQGPSYLSPLYETLLARALSGRKLIGFEQMEPSLIRLETPEEVQLAYAQGASAIEFILAKAGPNGVKAIMNRMTTYAHRGASDPIRDVLGMPFDEFERNWKEYLASKKFRETEGPAVRHYRIKEGKVDEERLDTEEIKSMVARNRTQLGDRLRERGRTGAAAMEYRRALAESRTSVSILNKLSAVLLDLDRSQEALDLLKVAANLSPDHPTVYTQLGETYLRLKDFNAAKEAFRESIQINPFNPMVHQGLAKALEALGNREQAVKEREIARKLISPR
jgi:tetratricopeptide (TPR) repeat protein